MNQPSLIVFVDVAHTNKFQKQHSTTGLVYTFCGGVIIYKSKTQFLTPGSSKEAELLTLLQILTTIYT